jgi:protein-disulfide isomerase
MKNFNVVIGVLVGAVIGFTVRAQMSNSAIAAAPMAAAAKPGAPAGAPPGSDQIFKVPVGDAPVLGQADAKVTIVEFSDFQCPFCGRVVDTVKQIEKNYGKDVRVAFKHNPLPMHPDAPYAAKAAVAASRQGKFWEMHDKLFEATNSHKPDALKPAAILEMAKQIGLDTDRFLKDVDAPATADQITADQAQARQIGAQGTPSFFINGAKVSGAQPYDSFKAVIDTQLKRAEEKLNGGVSRDGLYDALIKDGQTQPPAAPPAPAPKPEARKVDVDPSQPAQGGKSPKVTIVEWSDFQCPFCSRVEPTLKQIRDTYKDDVKIVWRNQPLPFHPNAMPAAKAAMAAHKQGKFWEMHDLMFANQKDLGDAKYEEWAGQIGLNVSRWKADLASPEIEAAIKKDSSEGTAVGADGTPTFFINGKLVSGAMPFESFKSIIDDQIGKADAELKKGTPAAKVYEALMAANVKNAPAPAAPGAADGGAPVKIDLGSSPVLGPKSAPVTMVIWSDFQCPFCSRVEPTLLELRKQYEGKMKLVWKNQPLPFHPNAMPAAKAAMAAAKQGKFWEMHDLMFANQKDLGDAKYEEWAGQLGLNVSRWKADLAAADIESAIQADIAAGNSLGANGTPTFFINGKKLVGAQPIDAFKAAIDAELAGKVAKAK